jgi:hypothetical protein
MNNFCCYAILPIHQPLAPLVLLFRGGGFFFAILCVFCGLFSPWLCMVYPCGGDCVVLVTFYAFVSSAAPPLDQPTSDGRGCCQSKVWVELKGILRIMPPPAFLVLEIWVGLKGLETVMSLLAPFDVVLVPLYVASIERTGFFLINCLLFFALYFSLWVHFLGAHPLFPTSIRKKIIKIKIKLEDLKPPWKSS